MRRALLCLLLVACSSKSPSAKYRPTVAEVSKRAGVPCEDGVAGAGIRSCGETAGPLQVTMFWSSDDKAADPHVTRFDLKIEAASGEAALAKLEPMIEGWLPPGQLDGIRTRLAGPKAAVIGTVANKKVTIDKVEVSAGTYRIENDPPRYEIDVTYY